jgi:ferric-chelate reductase
VSRLHASLLGAIGLIAHSSVADGQKWQDRYTIVWTSVLAFSTLASTPYIYRSLRSGKLYAGLFISETESPRRLDGTVPDDPTSKRERDARTVGAISRMITGVEAMVQSAALWTLPMPKLRGWQGQVGDCCRQSYFSLGVGQIGLVGLYIAVALVCAVLGAPLLTNANRPGESFAAIYIVSRYRLSDQSLLAYPVVVLYVC